MTTVRANAKTLYLALLVAYVVIGSITRWLNGLFGYQFIVEAELK